MKKELICISCCLMLVWSCQSCFSTSQYDVTLESLLDQMVNREQMTSLPELPFKAAQISSYDRRTISPNQPGWWANDDGAGYERIDTVAGRLEKVMCDLDGPGTITRIWMTTKEKFGTIRIYLDGSKSAQIQIPAYDMRRFPIEVPEGLSLTHTHYVHAMDGVGGNSFFLPIPYQKSCKITFEEPDITVKIPRYYHIAYRTYPSGTKVETFTLNNVRKLSDKIQSVSDELSSPSLCIFDNKTDARFVLSPGKTETVSLPEGTNKVSMLSIKAECPDSLLIECIFDGMKTVSVPLSHFCGAGYGAPDVKGWWLENLDGQVLCRFPMPYQSTSSISLVNTSTCAAECEMAVYTNEYVWTDRSLYFHVSFHPEQNIPVSPDYDSAQNLDWNFTTIVGKGVYVGDLLSLENHAIDWYGEGDEKIFVDTDTFPSFMGTGTEDYFNCSWAPVVPFLTPYGGAPRADEESSHGWNAFLRTRNLDLIPFNEGLKFDLEMLSWHYGTVDYYATSFWYGTAETVVK